MQIEIKECCGVHGEIADKGEILEVDDPTAKMLIAIGKAVPFADPDIPDADEPEIQTQDPEPTNRDPKPKKR